MKGMKKGNKQYMNNILIFGMTENPGGVESFLMSYIRKINRGNFKFDFCAIHMIKLLMKTN